MTEPDRTRIPEVKDFDRIILPKVERIGEAEGEIYVLPDAESELSKLTVVWRRGRADFDSSVGVAMMTAMLKRGTKRHDAQQLSEIIEEGGARINVVSGAHIVMFKLICLTREFGNMLEIAREMIKEPTFPEEYMREEAERMEADLKTSLQRVTTTASRRLAQLMMGEGHPRTNFANPGDMLGVTREEVEACHQAIMGRETPALYFTGKVDKKVEEMLTQFLQSITPTTSEKNPEIRRVAYKPVWETGGREIVEHVTPTVQAAVQFAQQLPKEENREDLVLQIAVHALGGYFGSRLSKNIREERGLTYGISAYTEDMPEGNLLRVECQTDEANVEEVIEQTKYEIESLRREPMGAEELNNAVRTLKSGIANQIGNRHAIIDMTMSLRELGKSLDKYERLQDVLEDVTAEEIRAVAEKYLDPERLTIVTTTSGGKKND